MLSLSEKEFQSAMTDAGCNVKELIHEFQASVAELLSKLHRGESK